MQTIRHGPVRGIPPSPSGPLHTGVRSPRGCTIKRAPDPTPSQVYSKTPDCFEAQVLPAAVKLPEALPEAEPVPPVTLQKRVTIADIKERRAKAGRLVAPTAAYSDANMFKGPVCKP